MSYRIAINSMATGKLSIGDSRWAQFNDSFINKELEQIDVANDIYMGHAYTSWHNGRRKKENFIKSSFIAVDLDTGDQRSDIDHLADHDLVQMYGGIIHTTPSHSPQAPRARVIFFLDRPIESPSGYSAAMSFISQQFNGADKVCKDPSRFFYGAHSCDLRLIMRELPVTQLRTLYRRYGRPAKMQTPIYQPEQNANGVRLSDYRDGKGNASVDRLVSTLRSAPQGERNHTLNKTAFIAGKMVEKREISESDAEQLKQAAREIGLCDKEINATYGSGFKSGRKKAV